MINDTDYIAPEIIPLTIRDRLELLARESGVKLDIVTNAYSTLLAGVDRNHTTRFSSALQITTIQLRDYVARNNIKPGKKVSSDHHTPAQVRYAEKLYVQLMGKKG